ncbi:MAG TPA: type III-B CRISPR module RAMP protein Cmr4 [Candidatus Paceibacterota bacterium]|nr:type III-B CRISPR module RAMP protein Cmr4 [Verrucomicrobiota bacterium]HRY48908.1 type III-B CRISPR module RAMP protein Cmr4 [Candidatus Paceibacterota bacterium]HRZ99120.1 type III-B CRISPR module RAMP protein Cmr4 [Candidatus Paceibacterota bacterium]
MHKLAFIITQTPLHIGTSAVDATLDQPILRERHTGFPILPGSTLKSRFAQEWTQAATGSRTEEGLRFFGKNQPGASAPGCIQFTEAKLLAFPVRSARGAFAWITSPLALRRLVRDGGMPADLLPSLALRDDQALFSRSSPVTVALGHEAKVVLEEYTFLHAGDLPATSKAPPPSTKTESGSVSLGDFFQGLLITDVVWQEVSTRLIVVNDGILSALTRLACEVMPHTTIDPQTGATRPGETYSQENVPAETLFFASIHSLAYRSAASPGDQTNPLQIIQSRLHRRIFQFGGDASTGLGFCRVEVKNAIERS